jgi:hypothetical protein
MVYIDLNMVRAGGVNHPSEWPFSGYNEIPKGQGNMSSSMTKGSESWLVSVVTKTYGSTIGGGLKPAC